MAASQQLTLTDPVPQDLGKLMAQCPALAEAAAYGVDIPMLLANLRRPVSERIRRLQQALNAIQQLRNAKRI